MTSFPERKAAFDKEAAGLPFFEGLDLGAELIAVEPINGAYFRNDDRQRCIIRRADGKLYLSWYD